MRYRATVQRYMTLDFDFDESEIEPGDDENIAAAELANSFSLADWNEVDTFVEVEQYDE